AVIRINSRAVSGKELPSPEPSPWSPTFWSPTRLFLRLTFLCRPKCSICSTSCSKNSALLFSSSRTTCALLPKFATTLPSCSAAALSNMVRHRMSWPIPNTPTHVRLLKRRLAVFGISRTSGKSRLPDLLGKKTREERHGFDQSAFRYGRNARRAEALGGMRKPDLRCSRRRQDDGSCHIRPCSCRSRD